MTLMRTEADPPREHPPPSLSRRVSMTRPEDVPEDFPLTPGNYSAVVEIACAISETAEAEGGRVLLLYFSGSNGETFKAYFPRKRALDFSEILSKIVSDLLPGPSHSAAEQK